MEFPPDLVIGDEPCTYQAVCEVISNSKSSRSFWYRLEEIAMCLKFPEEYVILINQWLSTRAKTHSMLLYDILEGWRGTEPTNAKLSTLITILEGKSLHDCADALKSHFNMTSTDKTSWNDLSDNLKLEISEKLVTFQGKKVRLADCIRDYDPSNIDTNFLAKLTEDKIPTLVNNPIQENLQYYIQRSIQSRTKLKKEVFQNNSSDIIMVEGIGRIELTRLAEGKETDLSGNQIKKRIVTVRLILLECDGDFERICKLTTQPVHWIKIKKDSYLWFKSSGTVENLQQYVHEIQETFIESNLLSVRDRVVIISDSPGMGKTLLLANIGKEFLKERPTTLVRFVVLKELVQELSNQPISIESIVGLIAEQSSDYHFGKEFTEHILKTSECILMFDGFDEVLSNHIDTARQILLEVVGKLASARIFVTTRPHMRGELEAALHVFSYTIQPFEEEDSVNFLQAFWKSSGVTTCISTHEFAKSILSSLTSNMTDFERSIAGIPLQCKLLAEAYMDEARRCTEGGYRAEMNDSKSSGLVATLFEMYERHMSIRFQNFCSEHSGAQVDAIKQVHMLLALLTVFPEFTDDVLSHRELCTLISTDNICRLGILEAAQPNGIRFVHRTFAEYFIAWFTVEQAQEKAVKNFLLSKVFTTSPGKVTIPCRDSLYKVDVMSFEFNFPVICYFINEFLKRKKEKEYLQKTLSTLPLLSLFCNKKDTFFASVSHNFIYMLEFVSNLLVTDSKIENWSKDTQIDIVGDLMLVAAEYADVEMMKIFATQINITEVPFRSARKFSKELCIITPLHVAIKRGHYNLVEYLINQYKSELISLRHLLNICVYNSLKDPTEVIDNKKLIIKLLLTHSKQWLEERFLNDYKATPLLQANANPELIECLIQEGADVNELDDYENTVLHKIAANPVLPEIFHRIVELLVDRGFKHFNQENYREKLTPLSSAVKSVELLDETLELFFSSGTDFDAVNRYGNSVIFNAIIGGRSVYLIQRLIHFGAKWKHINKRNESVLHFCAKHVHYDAMNYFMEKCEFNINARDTSLETPLLIAIKRTSPKHELIQRLLIESGANVNAARGQQLTPLQQAFKYDEGVSLNIIKLMEQNGLLITNTIASEVLQAILHNNRIKPNGELTNIFEYLIQKLGPHHQSQMLWNPWKFEKLRQKINDMIQLTTATPEFMSKLKDFGLLTANDVMQLEKTRTALKPERLYEIIRGNEAFFERYCLSLLSTNQFMPFEILRDTLNTVKDFTTAPPGVIQLLTSKDLRIIALLTNNVDMTTKRINDTIGTNVSFLDERDVATFVAERKESELTVVKCRDITMDLITDLRRVATFVKIIILCQNHHLELNGQIQTFKDEFTWEDISARSLRRFHWTVNQIDVDLREVFATADVLEHFLIENNIAFSCRNLGYKVGHRICNNGIPLSKNIFHFFLCDKLVFVGITQDELQQYTNLEHQIGSLGKNIENLDFIICEHAHQFEETCKQTSCNVHLIEHHEGSFMLVRSFGFDNEIKPFYGNPVLCDNFPECNCEAGLDDLMVQFTFNLTGTERTSTFSCKVFDLHPKMQRMLKLQYFMDFFQLTRIKANLVPQDKVEHPTLVTDKIVEQICLRIVNKISYLLTCLQTTKEEYHKLEQIAVNTLFPKLQNSTDISDLKKYAGVGMLLYKNDSLIFLNESLAWFFVAKMLLKRGADEVLKNKIFLNCFESRNIYDSISSFLFGYSGNVISYPTESVESFTYSNSLFFTFLDHLLTQKNSLTLINNLKIILGKDNIKKWVHSCVCANHYNLLKLIVNSGSDLSFFASEKLVLLAVKYASVPLISLIVEQYISRTKQNIKHIKLQRYGGDNVTVLHMAALRGDLSVVSYLLNKLGFKDTLNQPDMRNILHYSVVDTFANSNKEIEERKCIIKLLLQHSPFLIQKKDNKYSTPGQVPNIHVDLLIYLIELGLDVDATMRSNNLMHVCPLYMTPQDYHKLAEYIYKCGKSNIFHSKNSEEETVLHCAVKYLEVFQSTFDLFKAANVDFNATDDGDQYALFEAIKHGRSTLLLKRLVLSGADVLIRDSNGSTVLHETAKRGNFSSLKYLVSQKCDVRSTDKENNTPLHLVLKWSKRHTYEIVKLLLQHGASAHDLNIRGETPLSIALDNEYGKIGSATVELLKKA